MNRLIKTEEIAERIGVTPKTIRQWCANGEIFPTARKLGNKSTGEWRVLSDDVGLNEMLSGCAENATMLADHKSEIATLGAALRQLHDEYKELMENHRISLERVNGLEQELLDERAARQKNEDSLWDRIEDLDKYKRHYEKQQRRQAA